MSIASVPSLIEKKLSERMASNSYRELKVSESTIDFYSNDYLGFARSEKLSTLIADKIKANKNNIQINGSSGSRLLSGNNIYIEQLEKKIASIHEAESALLYNSGYDANVGLLSCIASRHDTIIYDELSHASIIDGVRLSYSNSYSFKHNDMESLRQKLNIAKGEKWIVVESIYSMDGDHAPLEEIAEISSNYGAYLIVDEAHATGVKQKLGMVMALDLHHKVTARIHTFGKAFGVHGAVIITNKIIRDYLINFSRSFIYSTAMPIHSICGIDAAYDLLLETDLVSNLNDNIIYFKKIMLELGLTEYFIKSNSAIQSIIISGNDKVKAISNHLYKQGFDVRPILSPTVSMGQERLRICIHAFNTRQEIESLLMELRAQLKIQSK